MSARRIYVGYLPMPGDLRKPVLLIVLLICCSLVAAAAMMALTTRDAGSGSWETGHAVALDGELLCEPFPMLRVIRDGHATRVLLVGMGKHGVQARCAAVGVQRMVRATGFRIERDGMLMLELLDDQDALVPIDAPAMAGEAPADLGQLDLSGEIVDSKCWMGVMQPGDGTTHRACAQLCIRGGIPPSLVCQASDGSPRRAIIVAPDGRAMPFERLEAWIGMPVRVRGQAAVVDGMAIVRVESIEPVH